MKVTNRKAFSDYEVLDQWEAGIILTGSEAKSAKKGAISLTGSRATILPNQQGKPEIWVIGMQISPYEFTKDEDYDPIRSRKLLLNKAEVAQITGKVRQKGLTLVPLECYNKAGYIKVTLALVRGKKKYEKREELKKRAVKREIEQVSKQRRLN